MDSRVAFLCFAEVAESISLPTGITDDITDDPSRRALDCRKPESAFRGYGLMKVDCSSYNNWIWPQA